MKSPRRTTCLVMALLLAGGCNRERDTLRIAVNNSVEGVALKYVAAAFANTRNVTVDIVELPYDDLYSEELKDVRKEKSAFDVIMLDDPWFTALLTPEKEEGEEEAADKNKKNHDAKWLLEPLTLTKEEVEEDFVKTCLDVCRGPGTQQLYALPFVGNTQLFVYRRTNDKDAPQTWGDVLIQQRALQMAEKKVGYVMRVRTGNSIVTDFLPILWAAWPHDGSSPSASDGRTRLALEQLKNLGPDLSSGTGADALHGPNLSLVAADDFDLSIQLVRREASMSIIWSAWAMALAKAGTGTPSLEDQLYVTEVPGGQPAMGAWLLAIPKGSKRVPLAREFLSFATEKKLMIEATKRGNPPTRESVFQDPELNKTYPWFQCQLTSLKNARPRPRIAEWRNVESELGGVLSDLYAGVLDPEGALIRSEPQLAPFRETTRNHPPITCPDKPLMGN